MPDVPFGALDASPDFNWQDAEAQANLAAQPKPKRSWYDTANEVAHAPGRMLGSLTASPASPEADQAAMSPETFVNPLVKNAADAAGAAIKSGVTAPGDALAAKIPQYDAEGHTSPEMIQRGFDTAAIAGGGSVAGTAERAASSPGTDMRVLGIKVRPAAELASDSAKPGAAVAAAEHAPPFYSALEQKAAAAPMKTAEGRQWNGMLQYGVKKDEMEATGLDKFLADNATNPVTKDQILDHLENNKVQIGEVTKGGPAADWKNLPSDEQQRFADLYRELEPEDRAQYGGPQEFYEQYVHQNPGETHGQPRYADYQLPGGENYREKLLTLPVTKDQVPNGYTVYNERGVPMTATMSEATAKARVEDNLGWKYEQDYKPDPGKTYQSSHWEDDPNVLLHMRMNDRDVTGAGESSAQKALHLEELQSDWHQQGRQKGYRNPDVAPTSPPGWEEHLADEAGANARLAEAQKVPDAPFKKNWHELGLKRALHEAAEGGYDRLSWTPGEAQAARYDLSKQLSRIEYHPSGAGAPGKINLRAYDPRGNNVLTHMRVSPEELPNIVGKEMADRIGAGAGQLQKGSTSRVLSGLDLKVGGEGMKGFYDKMVPDYLNKIGKPHGAQVKQGTIAGDVPTRYIKGGGLSPDATVHYMDITPSLRQHLLTRGMPLFEDSTPGAAVAAAAHAGEGNAARAGAKAGLDERGGLAGPAGGDPRLAEAQAAAARGAGAVKPLQDLPVKPVSINGEPYVPGPIGSVHDVARQYMESTGRPYDRLDRYHPLDPEHSKAIAKAFDEMKHEPDNPKVKASYNAMINETRDQYDAAMKSGLKAEPIRNGIDPYAANPRLAAKDVRDNNHLWYFPTEQGFGTGEQGGIDMAKHPMMQPSGRSDVHGKPMLNNDLFRVVHDYFGHLKEGNGFRAAGEDNAWRTHAKMYSDLARPAMTSETRGQNSWVNYGPHGETNRTASAADTHYSEQKAGLMPDWTMRDREHPLQRAVTDPNDLPHPGAKYPQYAEQYPPVGPPTLTYKSTGKPVPAKDIPKGKELARRLELPKSDPKAIYKAKENTPEALAFQKDRDKIRKDMATSGYEPFFPPEERSHVNPADYPTEHDMTKEAIPSKQKTIDEWTAKYNTPAARDRLQKAYEAGKDIVGSKDWYAMRQLEQQYIKHLGPEEGRKRFQMEFARSMAATTGGSDPTSNHLLSQYMQWMAHRGEEAPVSHQLPFPIGGRYVGGNVDQAREIPLEGYDKGNAKRHDFESAFLGHANKATTDEQMSNLIVPGMNQPEHYGLAAQVIHDMAEKNGVDPREFQEVAWAGAKKMGEEARGKTFKYTGPMINHVNESIERTHRLTGMSRNEVVRRGLVKKEIPLYSGNRKQLLMLGRPHGNNAPPMGSLNPDDDQ